MRILLLSLVPIIFVAFGIPLTWDVMCRIWPKIDAPCLFIAGMGITAMGVVFFTGLLAIFG